MLLFARFYVENVPSVWLFDVSCCNYFRFHFYVSLGGCLRRPSCFTVFSLCSALWFVMEQIKMSYKQTHMPRIWYDYSLYFGIYLTHLSHWRLCSILCFLIMFAFVLVAISQNYSMWMNEWINEWMNEWIYSLDKIKVSQAGTPRHDLTACAYRCPENQWTINCVL